MSLALLLSLAAAAWWFCSIAVLLLSFAATMVHRVRPQRASENGLPPVSAIVPVKDAHAGFAEAQRSLFSQNYAGLETLVAVADAHSPALEAVRDLGPPPPRVVASDCTGAASPKLNNLWPAICQGQNDLVVTKDSNIVLGPGDIEAFVGHLESDVGLVSVIPVARQPLSFPAWIEASIVNGYHARVLMLGRAVGLGFGLGKIMLFRRSDLARAGGFDRLKWAVGEDMALARAMRGLGLRTILADRECDHPLGYRSLADVWQRQLRWMTIWRVQLPAAFVFDLLGSALPTACAGAVAAHLAGLAPTSVFVATLVGWCALESILCAARAWPVSFLSPLAFLARELLTPLLWFGALMNNEVRWAGANYRVRTHEGARTVELLSEPSVFARGKAE